MRISPLTIISYPQPIPPLQASVATNTSPLDIQLDPTESKPSPMTQSVPHISFKEAPLQDMVMDLEISFSVPVEDLELTYNDSITSIDANLSMQIIPLPSQVREKIYAPLRSAASLLKWLVSLSVTNHCLHSL